MDDAESKQLEEVVFEPEPRAAVTEAWKEAIDRVVPCVVVLKWATISLFSDHTVRSDSLSVHLWKGHANKGSRYRGSKLSLCYWFRCGQGQYFVSLPINSHPAYFDSWGWVPSPTQVRGLILTNRHVCTPVSTLTLVFQKMFTDIYSFILTLY